MVPVLGRYAGLLTASLLGLVVFGPLAVFLPLWSALTLGAVAAAGSGLALARIKTLTARCEKLSGEVDLLSRRLLKVETAAAKPPPESGEAALRAQIEELTVEFGLLSGIVRDLTTVVSTQDAEVASLKARPVPAPPAPFQPAPVPPEPIAAAPIQAAVPPPAFQRRVQEPPAPEPPASAPIPPRPIPPRPVQTRPIPPRPVRDPASEAEIIRAFEGDGLEIHLQPVVSLPQRKVVAYEALARLRIGGSSPAAPVEPETFLPVLERYGRTTELDRRMLQRASLVVRHLARRGSGTLLTYSLSPLSLFEPGLLRELGRTVAEDPSLAGLVIALPQASWRGLDAGQRGLLMPLRGRIGFSLDRPDDLRFDAVELAALGIGQVRVPAAMLLRPQAGGSLSDIAVEDTGPALARVGIRLVATGVADEADIPDLIDLDVPFAQGAAFAAPRPVRAEVLTAPPETPEPPTEPGPERRPFRSVLRRAV
ncbi:MULTISPECIES: EAL domain-containing protein [unclassified Methylobacterium]|jgi:cyclic-di-GMP phosphodiesterase TipF (flagellum assembly factor)|uniref:EAL domain-containing protein n=1 Tax=unclassified Methylobacterium TaxID=2615210 RepID=UPI001355C7B2|nr:EAL domain-containing protein [Methylobacterium sp. 2A]MWV23335.1 EAL domain-containing protein [Methylobacterium sp. 2A]